MLRVTFLGRKWLWRSSVCTVRGCGFVGCGRHDLRTSLESALLLSLSSQLRPLRHYIPHPLYSLATSLFFVITSYESTNALQSLNLSVFTSLYSLTTSPFFIITSNESTNALQYLYLFLLTSLYSLATFLFFVITSYELKNGEIIRSRQLAKT